MPKSVFLTTRLKYSETCLMRSLKNRQNKGFKDKWYLNAGRKYCRITRHYAKFYIVSPEKHQNTPVMNIVKETTSSLELVKGHSHSPPVTCCRKKQANNPELAHGNGTYLVHPLYQMFSLLLKELILKYHLQNEKLTFLYFLFLFFR